MQPQYIGKDDYRGYVNYLAKQGDATAGQLLNYVGNDFNINPSIKTLGPVAGALGHYNQVLRDQYTRLKGDPLAAIRSALAGLGGGGSSRVYAPKLDFGSISAKARAAAEGAVNPLYIKKLNNYLAESAAKRQQQQKQFEMTVKNLEDQLYETKQGNEISRVRTTEDVASNLEQIATEADEFQVDAGTALEDTRAALGTELGASGLRGGLASQKVSRTVSDQNTQEQRQEQQFGRAREQQQLFKTRTFDDLLRSDELATKSTERGKGQAKFDLDSYIENLGLEERSTRDALEAERQGAIIGNERQQQGLLVRAFVDSIKNPAQREAALAAYGGLI